MAGEPNPVRRALHATITAVGLSAALAASASAQNALTIGQVRFDRPTPSALGIRLPISGDANQNSTVAIQYRESSLTTPNPSPWKAGLALWRVHPEVVAQETLSPEFAGSIFNLAPNSSYDIQLTISDPDGIVDQNGVSRGQAYGEILSGLTPAGAPVGGLTTRAVPADPTNRSTIIVGTSQQLTAALGAAQPGQIIQIAAGTYTGRWSISASGTAANPIVIRGANTLDSNAPYSDGSYNGTYHDNTVLDGQNCPGCNVLEVYGSYVDVEWVTIQNANRAIRSFNATTGNVYRRIHTRNTDYGFMGANSRGPQTDFYIADNILEGRIQWPTTCTFSSCGASSVDGIGIWGSGHVVAHNRLSGFGDAIATWYLGARSNDIYGNDVLWNYDDGTELDESEGNVRMFRNRISNSWEGISLQPINGGPAYIFRNIGVNIQNEQLKIHPEGTNPTSGFLAFNNTFASNSFGHAWNNQSGAPCYDFVVENNVFQGPVPLGGNYEVDANCHQSYGSGGAIDHNGYSTAGPFAFYLTGYAPYASYTPSCSLPASYGNMFFCSFADLQAFSPFEHHGQLIAGACPSANGSVFASCFLPPVDNTTLISPPPDLTLAAGSSAAAGAALVLPNVNDADSTASGPSLGAVESGCAPPVYGPREPGLDENSRYTCSGYSNGRISTTTTLASSPNPTTYGTPVTLTAAVTSSAGSPTGTVTFQDGGAAIGSGALDASGHATYTTATLSAGSHSITAVYGGDATFNGSTSAAVVQTVNQPVTAGISLIASPASATVSRGNTVAYTITITPTGGFTGAVSLSVAGAPQKSSATFTTNPVSIADSNPASSTLMVGVARNAAKRTYTLTVTGASGSVTGTVSVTLRVQ